jgi:hypothetical protein
MTREGGQTVLGLVILVAFLAGMRHLFSQCAARVPGAARGNVTFAHAAFLGVEETGVFHRSSCPEVVEMRQGGIPVLRGDIGATTEYRSRQEALDGGYTPCHHCNP